MSEPFQIDEALKQEIQQLVSRYDQKRAAMLPVLHLVQKKFGHITPGLEEQVGELLNVPAVHVHEVVSFYTLFRREPVGRNHIQMCSNVSCCLLGAEGIMEYVSKRLGIKAGQSTPDGKFTLSSVECLCACEAAPVLQWNADYIGSLTKEKIDELIFKAT